MFLLSGLHPGGSPSRGFPSRGRSPSRGVSIQREVSSRGYGTTPPPCYWYLVAATKQAVHMLLECILVRVYVFHCEHYFKFSKSAIDCNRIAQKYGLWYDVTDHLLGDSPKNHYWLNLSFSYICPVPFHSTTQLHD